MWRRGEEHLPSDTHVWTSAGRITVQLGAIQLADFETAHPGAFITHNYTCSLPVTVSLSVTSGKPDHSLISSWKNYISLAFSLEILIQIAKLWKASWSEHEGNELLISLFFFPGDLSLHFIHAHAMLRVQRLSADQMSPSFAEEWWAVHGHSAGWDAARHRIRNEVPVWHGLCTQGSGCQEYPHQQQLSLQGVRLRPLQSPRRWPRSSVHNQGELWGYWTDGAQEKCIPCHIFLFRISGKEISTSPEPLSCAWVFGQVFTS